MKKEPENALYVKSVEKTFAILDVFRESPGSLTLAAIAEKAGLDRSAAQRFVFTLHKLRYIGRNSENKTYFLSPRALEIGYSYLESEPIINIAQNYLTELHRIVGEAVNLAKLDDTDVILISRIPSLKPITLNIKVGARLPALYTASGRAIAAFLSRSEQLSIIERTELCKYTPSSIATSDEFIHELDLIKEKGFCISRSQQFQGDLSIGAPINDQTGSVIASLTVGYVEFGEPDQAKVKEVINNVTGFARLISKSM